VKFEETPLPGVYLLQPDVFGDQRGFFLESWNRETFRQAGFDLDFVQDNHSRSARGILRGMWHGATLSAENHAMLWVPPGFAHGFYVTSDFADFQYKCTDIYHPASEISLAWDDPTVGIEWPVPRGEVPQLSEKDRNGSAWREIPLL
jgi:dTDP-4-dehydrorhamnose 3,5-epimerase